MEELGFKLEKMTDNKIIYKKTTIYEEKTFLGIEKDIQVIIFNKNSKRAFLKRIILQYGEYHFEPFCANLELLNTIVDFIKNI